MRGKAYVILGFRIPTTSVEQGVRGRDRDEGSKTLVKLGEGSKAYVILGFRVSTTSVEARARGSKGSKTGARGVRWEQDGSEGE